MVKLNPYLVCHLVNNLEFEFLGGPLSFDDLEDGDDVLWIMGGGNFRVARNIQKCGGSSFKFDDLYGLSPGFEDSKFERDDNLGFPGIVGVSQYDENWKYYSPFHRLCLRK